MALKKGYKALVDEAMAQVKTYTLEEARAKHGDPNVQFVDIRDVRELEREGVIPGAYSAPRGMIEFWVDPDSPYFKPVFGEDKEFIFFCAAGWRSALTGVAVGRVLTPHPAEPYSASSAATARPDGPCRVAR